MTDPPVCIYRGLPAACWQCHMQSKEVDRVGLYHVGRTGYVEEEARGGDPQAWRRRAAEVLGCQRGARHRSFRPQAGEGGPRRRGSGLLRGWAVRVCFDAADGESGTVGVRGCSASPDADSPRGSGQDGPPGRPEASSSLPGWRADDGTCSDGVAGGGERSGSMSGGCAGGSASGSTPVVEVSASAWASVSRPTELDRCTRKLVG